MKVTIEVPYFAHGRHLTATIELETYDNEAYSTLTMRPAKCDGDPSISYQLSPQEVEMLTLAFIQARDLLRSH